VTPPLRGKRLLPRLAFGVVVLVLVVGAALLLFGGEGDVSNPDVTFKEGKESALAPAVGRVRGHPADDRFEWPVFGYKKSRTNFLPLRSTPRPPYRQAWALRGRVLLEFSPVLCRRRVFLLKNNGALYAISRLDGRVSWKRKLGTLAAASPACSHGVVYAVLLERTRGSRAGRVVAISARDGHTRWSRKLPSRAEGSPLLDRGRLYIGSEDGTVYALRARNGRIVWTTKGAGAVKGAIAYDSGKLYFGDYGGKLHAVRRSDGKKLWEVSAGGSGPLGLGDGNFYSTPAVRYGRVYIGNTNGEIYSFSSSDGKLAWRKSTGDYVYASPAVGQVRGGSPTVYIGSYDGHFYALDARTGRTRWVRALGPKISGGATVIGDLVFVSDLGKRTTWALGAGTGATDWKTHRGAFNPAISDGRRIYFTAYSSLFALDPVGHPFDRRPKDARQRHAAQRRAAARRGAAGRRAAARRRAIGRRVAARRRAIGRRVAARRHAAAHRAAVRIRAARRVRARKARQLKYRTAPHGHHHSHRKGGPPRCHRHRHVYDVRGKRIVLRHNHCHTHLRRR
jgi:outer membrane protein assembly factor BamB